jgi:hypothetical protein
MKAPPKKKLSYPGESQEELDASASDPDDQDDASSSQAPEEQMKGNKPHPLRRWARTTAEAVAVGLIGRAIAGGGKR